jgi:hypothetical protein
LHDFRYANPETVKPNFPAGQNDALDSLQNSRAQEELRRGKNLSGAEIVINLNGELRLPK